jgi:uncharacterized nucleotidyltransferase DUF6036
MSERQLKLDSPWDEFLSAIDEQLTAPARIICIGGFVVTKIHGFSRSTGDLDHIESPRELTAELHAIAGQGSPLHRKYHLYVDSVGVVTMPINFDERLIEVRLELKKISILVPDIYDLILSKLERNSPKDYADVQFLAEKYKLSFATLRKRFDEELDFMPNRERHVGTLDFWRDWFHE